MSVFPQPHPALWSAGHWPPPLYYASPPWWYPPPLYPYVPGQPTPPATHSKRIRKEPSRHELVPAPKSAPKSEPQLHRLFGGLRRPTCLWDVRYPHSRAQRITSRRTAEPIPPSMLRQPAAQPAVKQMQILCETFPWVVFVTAKPPGNVVTVECVFEAIYRTLQEPLHPDAWEEKCDGAQKKIYKAMCRRIQAAPPAIQATGQILKVDCLLHKTTFLGLRPAGPSVQEWFLLLGPER